MEIAWDGGSGGVKVVWGIRTAAAHEVHDLEFVTILQRGGFPRGTGNDFPVQLHRDAVRFHPQLRHEGGNAESVREFMLFAVDVEKQALSL